MAKNDIVLLDSLVVNAAANLGSDLDPGELFEIYTLDQLLKDYDLSFEEVEHGWVDGGQDGGIDGLYVLLDDQLLRTVPAESDVRRNPRVELWVVTVKRGDTFKQDAVDKLVSSLPELFDLRVEQESGIKYPFREEILTARELFRKTYVALASRQIQLEIKIIYACRGDTGDLATTVRARSNRLVDEMRRLFSNAKVQFSFMGATELLALARRQRTYNLQLRYIENTISRGVANCVVLCTLADYFAFVTDEAGVLRRYLFEANVRDYIGPGSRVNQDIYRTLDENSSKDDLDFWWLNNGITMVASAATPLFGKVLSIDNVQIVNGLQTTETIARYYQSLSPVNRRADDRAVLIKVIITEDDEVRDRIIKATNYQALVDIASMRATDKFQRDIEHYLSQFQWFYDRRKNYHRNQGKPESRIVSLSFMAAAVRAVALADPVRAFPQETKFMRSDADYRRVFDSRTELAALRVCLELARMPDRIGGDRMRRLCATHALSARSIKDLRFICAYAYAIRALAAPRFRPNALSGLADRLPSEHNFAHHIHLVLEAAERWSGEKPIRSRRVAQDQGFVAAIAQEFGGSRPDPDEEIDLDALLVVHDRQGD